MSMNYADLEITIRKRDEEAHLVDFRLTRPDSDETRTDRGEFKTASLDHEKLQEALLLGDKDAYGKLLTAAFFTDPNLKTFFSSYKANVFADANTGLRIRLFIGSDARDLYRLRWELLLDPETNFPIATSENILFSRYISSSDWRPVRLNAAGQLRALVFIANPNDLDDKRKIDVAGELERANISLAGAVVDHAPAQGSPDRATLNTLAAKLRENEYDILYIVCHGALNSTSEPVLWLEDNDGKTRKVSGNDLVIRLQEIALKRPKLVVLASCQSAGNDAGDALNALGPRLVADAGVPAVLAMQGNVSMETIKQFMPLFFENLQKDGYIDRALAVARGGVRDRPDAWMPVLFMRLISGRLWLAPSEAGNEAFDLWDVLSAQITQGKMTPIVGPGLFEPLLGSLQEIAQGWASRFNYPLASYERDSLPKVAQYLYGLKTKLLVQQNLEDSLRTDIQQDYASELPDDLKAPNKPTVAKLISTIGAIRRQKNPFDSYRILAKLPISVYITTNLNDLLADALIEEKKQPKVMLCPWNKYTLKQYKQAQEFEPDPEHPLVFHMFGRLAEPDSMVITEDDYFDFLLGYSRNAELIPGPVTAAITDAALLFLGFQVEDWGFRMLFRSITNREGGVYDEDIKHVAAQFIPEEGRIADSIGVQRYLEKYLGKRPPINLYWGSVDGFLKELAGHLDLKLE